METPIQRITKPLGLAIAFTAAAYLADGVGLGIVAGLLAIPGLWFSVKGLRRLIASSHDREEER